VHYASPFDHASIFDALGAL